MRGWWGTLRRHLRWEPPAPTSQVWLRCGPQVMAAVEGLRGAWSASSVARPADRRQILERWLAPVVTALAGDVALDVRLGGTSDLGHWFWCGIDVEDRRLRLTLPDPVAEGSPPGWMIVCRLVGAMIVVATLAGRVGPRSCSFTLGLGDDAAGSDVGFCASDPDICLIPDGNYLLEAGLLRLRTEIARSQPAWADRSPTIFWRGSTTGRPRPPGSYDAVANPLAILPRLDMCERLSRGRHRARCDVGVSRIVQIGDPALVALVEERLLRPFVEPVDQLAYRHQIVIDGNSSAWVRFPAALAMGACVLLVASPHGYRQWFYDQVVPWTHVVPVASDLSDLEERVDWVLTHDAEAEAIAGRGRELAARLMLDEIVDACVSRLELRFARGDSLM